MNNNEVIKNIDILIKRFDLSYEKKLNIYFFSYLIKGKSKFPTDRNCAVFVHPFG